MIIQGEALLRNEDEMYEHIKETVHRFMGKPVDYDIVSLSVTDVAEYYEDTSLAMDDPIRIPGTGGYHVEWKVQA